MSGYSVDITDSSLARVGSGPLLSASRATIQRKLDQAGTFTIEASGSDPSTAEVLAKRIAQIGGLLGTPAAKVYSTFGSGTVDNISRRVNIDTGEVNFVFSGSDLLGELANTSVLNTVLDNGAAGPITVAAAIALIAPFVPAWTIDTTTYASSGTTTNTSTSVTGVTNIANFSIGGPISGTGIPAGATVANIVGTTITLSAAATASGTVTLSGALIYLKFAGESVLTALNKIAAAVGHHFRQNGTGRGLVWLYKVQVSSGVRIISAGDGEALVNNDEVALIQSSLEMTSDTHDIVTRIYPFGGGNSTARVTLNNATMAAPAGYTMVIDTDPQKSYIQHTAAVALYGVIERQVSFKDASPNDTTATATTSTGNQILTQAVEYLRLHVAPLVTYRFRLVKLDVAVYPGQTVQLVFRRTVDGYRAVDEDVTLFVLDSTLEFRTDGDPRTAAMTVATTDRRPASEVGTLVSMASVQSSMDNHVQQAALTQGLRVAAGQTLYVAPGASPTSGQALAWNSGTSQYEPASVGTIGAAPVGATYITQTADATLTAEQALSALATGYLKNTTGTGVLSSQATPIPAADGGTGVSNAGTLAVGANATLSGGGTISLGGFTFTVPATGTAALLAIAQTFSALCAFTGGLQANGIFRVKTANVAANATIAASNVLIRVTSTAAARTLTLPAAGQSGQIILVADESLGAGTNNITMVAAAGETLIGNSVINTNGGFWLGYSNGGTQWMGRSF
jgi:hypothetical protein